MSLISTLRRFILRFYDYPSAEIDRQNIKLAVIHIPDQIGDAMSVFPVIRSLEINRVKHLVIVTSTMNKPVFASLVLKSTQLTLLDMRFQDHASFSEIKNMAEEIRRRFGVPDICIEAMRKKNIKTMYFISKLRATQNLQMVGLKFRCYAPCCRMASKMDQTFRTPVPMTWSLLMREAGFPPVRPAFEFPLDEAVLSEVRRETQLFGNYIAFNLEGSVEERTFSLPVAKQLIDIIRAEVNLPVVIVHGPKGVDSAAKLTEMFDNVHHISLSPSIRRSAAVVHDALIAITPDTAILHMTSAFNIPAIAIYACYKSRWPAMQDISETIIVGRKIDYINVGEFRDTLKRLLGRVIHKQKMADQNG